jgi:hypothetical protein
MDWSLGPHPVISIDSDHVLQGKAWRWADDLDNIEAMFSLQTGEHDMIPHFLSLASMMNGND